MSDGQGPPSGHRREGAATPSTGPARPSGRATRLMIDAVILVSLLEALALWTYREVTSRGLEPADYAFGLAAGLCLMMAVRTVLTGCRWPATALCLMASGCAHSLDLWVRFAQDRA